MHGYLQLVRYRDSEYPRPVFDHEIAKIGPGYTEEEEAALDYLWYWLRIGRGLFIGVNWFPEFSKVKKTFSKEIKLKIAKTKWKTKLMNKYPLFWEDIYKEKVVELEIRYK